MDEKLVTMTAVDAMAIFSTLKDFAIGLMEKADDDEARHRKHVSFCIALETMREYTTKQYSQTTQESIAAAAAKLKEAISDFARPDAKA